MSRFRTLAAVCSFALVLVSLGCGGSDNNSAEPTTTASTSGGNERLSNSSWATYETEAAKAKAVNDAAITTFRKCRSTASRSTNEEIQACLGDSMSTVVTEGQKLLDELDSLEGEASGACATALNTLKGNVKLYVASVNTLESSVKGEGVGGHGSFATQLDNTQQILVRTRTSVPPVEAACKPA